MEIHKNNNKTKKEKHFDKFYKDSGIAPENYKYFKPIDLTNQKYYIEIISIVIWIIFSWIYYSAFYTHNKMSTNQVNDKQYFIIFMSLLFVPFTCIVYKIVNIYLQNSSDNSPFIPPDFGMCFDTSKNVPGHAKKHGVIGAIDMKCTQTQYQYIRQIADELQAKSYYIMYGLFTLVLLFFTMKLTINKKNIPFDLNNYLVKIHIKSSLIFSLLLLSSPVLMLYKWSSLSLQDFYSNLIIMNVTSVNIVVSYIVYKLLKHQ